MNDEINQGLREYIKPIKNILDLEENLESLELINATLQYLKSLTGAKIGRINLKEERRKMIEKPLSFQYDREPFIELEKQQEHESTDLV